MKLRCALVLFLTACACAFGQSASTILSSLRIKGATSEGGDPKYENYIPRLSSDGRLDYSFIPTNAVFDDIVSILDDTGVKFNTEYTLAVSNSLGEAISNQFARFDWLAYEMSTQAVEIAIDRAKHDNDIMEYRNDKAALSEPLFTNMFSVAVGAGAKAENGGWQFGSGTNTTEETLKFYSTTLVNSSGEVPQESVPWAASTNALNNVSNMLSSSISDISNRVAYIETSIPTNILLRSATKIWELTITDAGDLKIKEYNQ